MDRFSGDRADGTTFALAYRDGVLQRRGITATGAILILTGVQRKVSGHRMGKVVRYRAGLIDIPAFKGKSRFCQFCRLGQDFPADYGCISNISSTVTVEFNNDFVCCQL